MTSDSKEIHDVPPLRARRPDSHKGDYGKVLIIAGSRFMPGAAVLAARAAYRAGSGVVTVLSDTDVVPIIAAGVVEAIHTDWATLGAELAIGDALPYDAALVGPGLGIEDRGRLVLEFLRTADLPVIIDADALNLVARDVIARDRRDLLPNREDRIWTPHPGELQRLTGQKPRRRIERLEAANEFATSFGGVVALKGHRTVVADASQHAFNQTGNAGMATAGSGDVLAGILVGLLGHGYAPFEAARLAVHLHGASGDSAAERFGQASMTASDMIDELPDVMQSHPVSG